MDFYQATDTASAAEDSSSQLLCLERKYDSCDLKYRNLSYVEVYQELCIVCYAKPSPIVSTACEAVFRL